MPPTLLSVLLFHLHNHYALISGWRELEAPCLKEAALPCGLASADGARQGGGDGGCAALAGMQADLVDGSGAGEAGAGSACGEPKQACGGGGHAPAPSIRRQILTARVGQQQQHWVDWEGDFETASSKTDKKILRKSVRTTLTSWKGHKIMMLEKIVFESKRASTDLSVRKLLSQLSEGQVRSPATADACPPRPRCARLPRLRLPTNGVAPCCRATRLIFDDACGS